MRRAILTEEYLAGIAAELFDTDPLPTSGLNNDEDTATKIVPVTRELKLVPAATNVTVRVDDFTR